MGETRDLPRFSFRSLFTFDVLKPPSSSIDLSKTAHHEHARTINFFGEEFLYHRRQDGGRHLTPEQLEPYRMVGDPILDDLLEYMDTEGYPLKAGDDLLSNSSTNKKEDNKNTYPVHIQDRINAFVNRHRTLPSWVDVDQLQRGQSVFLRFVPAVSLSLYYRSLCAGFSIPKIAAVITSTGYLAPSSTPEQVAFRLVDTGALVNSCMGHGGVDSIVVPGGEGWKICLHVRILHAKVRRTLLHRQGKRAWNINEYGIPINQEDMAATLLAFSTNTLVGVEFFGGVTLSKQDQEDYIALWRYVGWLLGVDTAASDAYQEEDSFSPSPNIPPLDPCGPGWDKTAPDSIKHATSMLQSMVLHLMTPDQSSVKVSHHLLKIGRATRHSDDYKVPTKKDLANELSNDFWFHFRALACRRLIGNPLADALELPLHPRFFKRFLIYGGVFFYFWVVRVLTWISLWEFGGKRLEGWFLGLMSKFHAAWTERHPSRMAKALQVKSCCPFAMVTK